MNEKIKNLDYKLKGLKAVRLRPLLNNYSKILFAAHNKQTMSKTENGVAEIDPKLYSKIGESKEGVKALEEYAEAIKVLKEKSEKTKDTRLKATYNKEKENLDRVFALKVMTLPGVYDSYLGVVNIEDIKKDIETEESVIDIYCKIFEIFLDGEDLSFEDLNQEEMDEIIKNLYSEKENRYEQMYDFFTRTQNFKRKSKIKKENKFTAKNGKSLLS